MIHVFAETRFNCVLINAYTFIHTWGYNVLVEFIKVTTLGI